MLEAYLQQHYTTANDNEQMAFKKLLLLEDPVLYDLLLGSSYTQDEHQERLIMKLRGLLRD